MLFVRVPVLKSQNQMMNEIDQIVSIKSDGLSQTDGRNYKV